VLRTLWVIMKCCGAGVSIKGSCKLYLLEPQWHMGHIFKMICALRPSTWSLANNLWHYCAKSFGCCCAMCAPRRPAVPQDSQVRRQE
jgi:hypothetical protein